MPKITEITSRGELVLEYKMIGNDIQITLTGGRGHIGAVAVGHYDKVHGHASSSVITLPSHRDDAIALDAARKISSAAHTTTVFITGIHFDDITKEEIEEVILKADKIIENFIELVREM